MDIDCRACNYHGNLHKCAERIGNFRDKCHSSSVNKFDFGAKARRVREEIIKRDYDILKALSDDRKP